MFFEPCYDLTSISSLSSLTRFPFLPQKTNVMPPGDTVDVGGEDVFVKVAARQCSCHPICRPRPACFGPGDCSSAPQARSVLVAPQLCARAGGEGSEIKGGRLRSFLSLPSMLWASTAFIRTSRRCHNFLNLFFPPLFLLLFQQTNEPARRRLRRPRRPARPRQPARDRRLRPRDLWRRHWHRLQWGRGRRAHRVCALDREALPRLQPRHREAQPGDVQAV